MTSITTNYWAGKMPCWDIMDCSRFLREKCPAFLRPNKPCWEQPTTECQNYTGICRSCPDCTVYRRYHPFEKLKQL